LKLAAACIAKFSLCKGLRRLAASRQHTGGGSTRKPLETQSVVDID